MNSGRQTWRSQSRAGALPPALPPKVPPVTTFCHKKTLHSTERFPEDTWEDPSLYKQVFCPGDKACLGSPPGDCWVLHWSHPELQPNSVRSLCLVLNFLGFTHLAAWLWVDTEAKPKSKPSAGWPSMKGPPRCPRGTAGPGGDPSAALAVQEEGAQGRQHSIVQDDSVWGGSGRKDTRPRASWPAVPTPCGADPTLTAKCW